MSEQTQDPRKQCQLHSAGEMALIDQRSNRPAFVCAKCRRKANRSEYLHNPLPIQKGRGDSFWG